MRRAPGLRVGPRHLPALVPGVIQQPGARVAGVLLHHHDLVHDVVKSGRLIEGARIFRVEWPGHIHAVQPHLVGVDLFVPETARPGARLRPELRAQQVHRLLKPFLAGGAVEQEQQPPGIDLVEVVFADPVGQNIPRRGDQRVQVVPDIVIVARFAGLQPHLLDRLVHQPIFVMPAVGHCPLHHRIDHAHRPCLAGFCSWVGRVFQCCSPVQSQYSSPCKWGRPSGYRVSLLSNFILCQI